MGEVNLFVHGIDALNILSNEPVQFLILAVHNRMVQLSSFDQGQFSVNEIF